MQIPGVRLIDHRTNPDARGSLSTVYHEASAGTLAQWNCLRSKRNALRGLHAHSGYDEVYVPLEGRMFLLLKDAREGTPSFGAEIVFRSDDLAGKSLVVPRGVAHGIYFETDGMLVYGLSQSWTGVGEFACRWDDPAIESRWPAKDPILSSKDRSAGSFRQMAATLARDLKPA